MLLKENLVFLIQFSSSTPFFLQFSSNHQKGTEDIENIGDFIAEMGESLSTVLLLQEVFMVLAIFVLPALSIINPLSSLCFI